MKDDYYLDIAKAVASAGKCLRKQYGAVIVKNDEIIATGYNGAPRGEISCPDAGKCFRVEKDYTTCRAVHAEQNAIISAPRREMIDATLYLACLKDGVEISSPAPCAICRGMIKNAGIKFIVTRERMYQP